MKRDSEGRSESRELWDAIVVGSGVSGGWAAKELTERGLRVLVLERGRDILHGKDYVGEHLQPWQLPFAGLGRSDEDQDYAIQSRSHVFEEGTRHFFNNDRLNPYVYEPEKPFVWIRADGVGGRSLIWGRQTYRFGPDDFRANERDGHGVAWPISYQDLAPWYSHVEDFIGVSGQAEGLRHLPDGNFLPPMEMFGLEKLIKLRLKDKLPQLTMTIGRCAILTRPHRGRGACHYCGPCPRGCSTGSYFSSQSSTLPAARATGRLTLRPNSVVERLVLDTERGRVSSVDVIDAVSHERLRFASRMVFLCASTVASTQILLNSGSESFPDGLGNSSGVLGRYLMDHAMQQPGTYGVFVDDLDRYFYGNRPNCSYIPRFRNLAGEPSDASFTRGYGFQAYMFRGDWRFAFNQKGFGAQLKETLRKPNYWTWTLQGFGECLPQRTNRILLDRGHPDRFGIPQVRFEFSWSDNELRMLDDMNRQARKIMQAAGAVFFASSDAAAVPGLGIHEMGTARMGHDPRTSFLNGENQSHDVPNLFVVDGACMASSSCVNPSLTYMALTARACALAASRWSRGEL